MSFLLDTNVISELRKAKQRAARPVRVWAEQRITHELSVSVITVIEIEIGVARLERRDVAQGAVLRQWFEHELLAAFDGRMPPIDLDVVRRAATLHVPYPSTRTRRSDRRHGADARPHCGHPEHSRL